MVSIEGQIEDEVRFDFNKPFECVDVIMGHSNRVFPTLEIGRQKSIIWLDYDYELAASVLRDIDIVVMEAQPGSVLAVTVDAERDRLAMPRSMEGDAIEPEWPEDEVSQLRRLVGERHIPLGFDRSQLRGEGLRKLYYGILTTTVEDALAARNSRSGSQSKILAKQVFHFAYADGAEMLTLGWLLFEEGQQEKVEKCDFEHLEFYCGGEDPYRIGSPKLTCREMRHLDRQLPVARVADLDAPGCIPRGDIEAYVRTYRWFPTFAEADL